MADKRNWPSVRETQSAEMLERGGRLNKVSGVYESRDRADVELGKFCEPSLEGW